MNTLKKVWMVTICMLVGIMLASCSLKYRVNIEKDGGTIVFEQTMTKDQYESMVETDDDGDITPSEDATVEFYSDDGVEYAKISKKDVYDSLEDLEKAVLAIGTEVNEDGTINDVQQCLAEFHISLDEKKNKFKVTGTFNELMDEDNTSMMGASLTLYLTFPGKVTYYNIGDVVDEKTVTINLLNAVKTGTQKDFLIEANASFDVLQLMLIIIPIVILVGLASFTMVVIYRNRRQGVTPMPINTTQNSQDFGSSPLAHMNGESNNYYNNGYYPENNENEYEEGEYPEMEDTNEYAEPESYLDDNGNMYYLDSNGDPYYLDDYGNPFYIDPNGNPYYIDSNGNPFYVDEEGRPFYVGEDGNMYYITDENVEQ